MKNTKYNYRSNIYTYMVFCRTFSLRAKDASRLLSSVSRRRLMGEKIDVLVSHRPLRIKNLLAHVFVLYRDAQLNYNQPTRSGHVRGVASGLQRIREDTTRLSGTNLVS